MPEKWQQCAFAGRIHQGRRHADVQFIDFNSITILTLQQLFPDGATSYKLVTLQALLSNYQTSFFSNISNSVLFYRNSIILEC